MASPILGIIGVEYEIANDMKKAKIFKKLMWMSIIIMCILTIIK